MKICAIVPIKLNNERLPGKNTKLLAGRPLVSYILDTLVQVDYISENYVFCSSDEIVDYLPDGIKFLKRPKYLDSPTSNFNQIFDAFKKQVNADIYIYAHATAPFLRKETIIDCLDKVLSAKYDSAFTATKIQDYLWENGKALNFDPSNLPRSQDLTPIYRETSGVYVFTDLQYCKNHRRIGDNPYIKEVPFKESIDINNPEDFELAEIFCKIKY